jgi:hypothetical protein
MGWTASKQFFFEKKNQKTFIPSHAEGRMQTDEVFCFFLFTKRRALEPSGTMP